MDKKQKSQLLDFFDSLIAVIAIMGLCYWFGWFPFNGFMGMPCRFADASQQAPSKSASPAPAPQQPKLSPPATYDDLAKAFVSICPANNTPPTGSGVFLGHIDAGGKLQVHLFTAAHVAATADRFSRTNSVTFIVSRPNQDTDIRKTVWMDDVGWRGPNTHADIAEANVTTAFNKMVRDGLDVKFIPLVSAPVEEVPSNAVKGVVAVRKKDFPQYRLGIGTDVRMLGTSVELWMAKPPKERTRQPMTLRCGVIARCEPTLNINGSAPNSSGEFLIDARIQHGFSGGPVFATVKAGVLEYPAFVGIVSAFLPGYKYDAIDGREPERSQHINSGYGVVVPTDDYFR